MYVVDFYCYNKIIVELKSVSTFANEHFAQLLNYMKATSTKVGLLINFGKEGVEFKRLVM